MIITFNLEINGSKVNSTEKSILIRCTQNRVHRRIGTGIAIPISSWNKAKQQVKSNHPLSKEYNTLIVNKLKAVIQVYNKLIEDGNNVSLDDLVNTFCQNTSINFYEFAYKTKMAEIKVSNKLGTFRRYETALNKFKAFTGSNLNINKIDYNLLKRYELYLLNSLKNTRDTASSNLSIIRTIINEGIRSNAYSKSNPFDQIQLKYTDNTKEKLTAEELISLKNVKLPPIPTLILARDIFMSCFLAEGTRAGDMIAMQKDNIINGHLVFRQRKTGKQMSILITDELETIFNSYSTTGKFIFPLLNNVKEVNEIVINSKLTAINKYLKDVAKYAGIFKKLTTHVGRHTFTDLALKATNGNIYLVQQSLGHSSVKTTELYSRNRVNLNSGSIMTGILSLINTERREE